VIGNVLSLGDVVDIDQLRSIDKTVRMAPAAAAAASANLASMALYCCLMFVLFLWRLRFSL